MPHPNLNPALARALAARGYATLTPVQAAVAEPDADGRDLIVSPRAVRCGSGSAARSR